MRNIHKGHAFGALANRRWAADRESPGSADRSGWSAGGVVCEPTAGLQSTAMERCAGRCGRRGTPPVLADTCMAAAAGHASSSSRT